MKVPNKKNGKSSANGAGPSRRPQRRSARLRAQGTTRTQRSDSSKEDTFFMLPEAILFRVELCHDDDDEPSTSSSAGHANAPRRAGPNRRGGRAVAPRSGTSNRRAQPEQLSAEENERGVRLLRQIHQLQNSPPSEFPRLPFAEIVGGVLSNISSLESAQPSALEALHDASEAYLMGTLEDAMLRGVQEN